MKYFLVCGETSGDQHGSDLMRALLLADPEATFQFSGGAKMQSVANGCIQDIKEMQVMGLVEVVKSLTTLRRIEQGIRKAIIDFSPDAIIFIDYPGMNLRLARWAKRKGYKTAYYILPKAWAWKASRASKIAKYIDLPLSIFPFEIEFYKKYNVDAKYVGNPSVRKWATETTFEKILKRVALIPGSRNQEVRNILPAMIEAVQDQQMKDLEIVVSKAPNVDINHYQIAVDQGLSLTEDYKSLIATSSYALVASGTATLEVGLQDITQIVCYRTHPITYHLAKLLVKVPYISLVNLICEKEVVPELIQASCNPKDIRKLLEGMINKTSIQRYDCLKKKLGNNDPNVTASQLLFQLANGAMPH